MAAMQNAVAEAVRAAPSAVPDGAETPLADVRFCVFDLETTGGAPPEHRVTEIAAYRIENLTITGEFCTLVNPQRSIPSFITKLTGIDAKMVRDKPACHHVLPEMLEFMQDSVLVAHHSQFDRKFLENELALAGLGPLDHGDLCTSRLARRMLPWLPSKSLGSLAQFFGIPMQGRHRASDDARATGELLLILLDYLTYRGHDTLEGVMHYQQGDGS
jgi:DNA polymerase-3 subunit epsilon